jgi:hypothetical protein
MKSRWLRIVLVGTMLLVLASVGVGVLTAQVAPERPNFVGVMTDDLDTLAGSGTSNKLVGEGSTDTVRGGQSDPSSVSRRTG